MALSKQISNRFDLLTQPESLCVVTYVWIDASKEYSYSFRFKSRTLNYEQTSNLNWLPWWDCGAAYATSYINTDILLKPVCLFNNPFYTSTNNIINKLVLCENFRYDKSIAGKTKINKFKIFIFKI